MFKKLLTNLPYNPSLIGQVSFYAKRLHSEEKIRRLGVVFVVLAFMVQMFAFISQPEPTLAESDNDILRGGFSTRADATSKCRNNTQSFATILAHYGVNCDQVASAPTVTIRSNAADYDSLGRNQQGPTIHRPLTGKTNPTDEYPVDISGAGRFWMRNLRAWDSYDHSEYQVLKITKADGKVIMIMYNCGNVVTVGQYTPPIPPPTDYCPDINGIQASPTECKPCEGAAGSNDVRSCLSLSKTARNNTQDIANADGTVANGGDSITYTLAVKNTGKVKVEDFVIEENVSDILDYADITDLNGATREGTFLRWPATDISPDETVRRKFTVKVKNPIPSTPISASDPARFDLVMNNVYGNQVTIKLTPNAVKAAEIVTQSLPKTGPGETMMAVTAFTIFVSYFFARTRLFAKEMDIVRTDYGTSGGY